MPVIQKVNLDEVVNPNKNHVAPSSEDSSSAQSGEFNIQGRSNNSFVPSLMQQSHNQPNLSMSYEMDPNNINMFWMTNYLYVQFLENTYIIWYAM